MAYRKSVHILLIGIVYLMNITLAEIARNNAQKIVCQNHYYLAIAVALISHCSNLENHLSNYRCEYRKFHEIASSCCPDEAAECCANTIEQRKPLNCLLSFEDLVAASTCIQNSLFGTKSLEISRIEDDPFSLMMRTPERENYDDLTVLFPGFWRIVALRPSSPTPQRGLFHHTQLQCDYHSVVNRSFPFCFRRCQSFLRSRQNSSEKFPYLAVCDLAERLEYGELYIGPELKD
ncbi:hypothetical protein KIN20_007572 [Parelaphostrongylus tenuis]|uniref:Uncharacterized protein n=1 Tax=Parelaphostrongylus tenuis TaxID=148309 RepID=A0AAD5MVQ0_PARTN|nr:hypothetical protein KIN20_007572 [Parelaphostrongylus tenuis]